ncbi:MAG: hypothetical protein U0795_20195 [Pirellulales bacterium]
MISRIAVAMAVVLCVTLLAGVSPAQQLVIAEPQQAQISRQVVRYPRWFRPSVRIRSYSNVPPARPVWVLPPGSILRPRAGSYCTGPNCQQ